MAEEFGKLGLASATQKYSFEVHGEVSLVQYTMNTELLQVAYNRLFMA